MSGLTINKATTGEVLQARYLKVVRLFGLVEVHSSSERTQANPKQRHVWSIEGHLLLLCLSEASVAQSTGVPKRGLAVKASKSQIFDLGKLEQPQMRPVLIEAYESEMFVTVASGSRLH